MIAFLAHWLALHLNIHHDVSWTDVAQVAVQSFGLAFIIFQVRGLQKTLHSASHSAIYDHYVDTVKLVMNKPHLYPYLREDARLDENEHGPEADALRAQVLTLCELTTTLFEHATLEKDNMTRRTWKDCWRPYMVYTFKHSPELRRFYESNRTYYLALFRDLIETDIAPKCNCNWNPAALQSKSADAVAGV